MPIVLKETQRALFYAPFYAAFARDAFQHAGVDVVFEVGAAPADAARAVIAGDVDVAWGGPMRVMLNHDLDPRSDLVCFCEVVTRDPFLLVGSHALAQFRLSDLRGLRIGAVREVPTPWLCLQEDLRGAGLDPSHLAVSFDRSLGENAAALRRGDIDVIQTLDPFAEELLSDKAGHILYAQSSRGHTSYTSFYARRAALTQKRSSLQRMTDAIYQTQMWIHAATPEEIAGQIAPYFDGVPQLRLSRAIARYKALRIWGIDPYLPRTGYERLQAGLLSGGLIHSKLPFEIAVDNSFARQAISGTGQASPAIAETSTGTETPDSGK